jgi:UDP-N-acetylglucosamine 3-dehydrogenase
MKIALLGTSFGQAHAAVYAARPDVDEVVIFGRTPEKLAQISDQFGFRTTTDLDALLADASVGLVDICLPTTLHADVAIRAMRAGNDVLIELPLADTLDSAHRIVAAQQATGHRAFVDMFSRFIPVNQHLGQVVADQRYGELQVLELESHTALLWEGYDLSLQTLAMDMMHASFDLITGLLGQPQTIQVTGIDGAAGRGSATEVVLGYPHAIARCTGSALMPNTYGMSGGTRATFTGAVLEYAIRAGFTGQGPSTLTAYTAQGQHPIDLPSTSPYEAMIDHVLACLNGQADNLIEPASALAALELTLDVQHRLIHAPA